MQLCKVQVHPGENRGGILLDEGILVLQAGRSISEILHAAEPAAVATRLVDSKHSVIPLDKAVLLAPIDRQEVWAAGVTYKRSQEARERESAGAARFYDLVYSAPRPELFFKATAERVVGPNAAVRIRQDSRWSVPEPELTLVVAPDLRIVGCTIGNDMSSRDIEGENPLYLPQAKIYRQSCAIGPFVTLMEALPPADQVTIRLSIERGGQPVFDGSTRLTQMKRPLEELVAWLGRENHFPHGVYLLTGTGVVPPDDFSLAAGDVVAIEISGIGRLVNTVVQGA